VGHDITFNICERNQSTVTMHDWKNIDFNEFVNSKDESWQNLTLLFIVQLPAATPISDESKFLHQLAARPFWSIYNAVCLAETSILGIDVRYILHFETSTVRVPEVS
jgi:hypothetical protein